MSRTWTPDQQNAINAKGGSLIVSAAAGSGKTAVLVERVIERITDQSNPTDVDRLLVVTYTRAAASQLKSRLNDKLAQLISADPSNAYYRRQQTLLCKANISTVDSFCSSVVHEFFYLLGIDKNFRIADNGELSVLQSDALKLTLDAMYSKNNAAFFELVEAFSGTKDDLTLEKIILNMYNFLRSHPFPEKWLDEKLSLYDDSIPACDTVWGKIITDYATDALKYLTELNDSALDALSNDEELMLKTAPLFYEYGRFIESLEKALNSKNWNTIVNTVRSFNKGRFNTPKGYTNNPYKLCAQSKREIFSSIIKSFSELFGADEELCKAQIGYLGLIAEQLFLCVKLFSQNYSALKLQKNVADYSDLEQWTLDLLINSDDMSLTDTAKKLQTRFDEILIDEFQDANEVQDTIFRAISKNDSNIFVVGDAKQSIYAFRQAMPELFLSRRKHSEMYDKDNAKFPARIILGKNFRSRDGITDAVNFVFKKLMSMSVGDMEYSNDECLVCGADYPNSDQPCTELHMLDLEALDESDADIPEAMHIAETIRRMMYEKYTVTENSEQRVCTYGDFAVLMRNATKHAPVYVETLIKCGIPAYCESSYSFLDAPEIGVIINFLRVIDNPALDIELLSVMMHPIYAFSADDMAQIRARRRDMTLYSSVIKAAHDGNKKCEAFLSDLKKFRNLSVSLPVFELIGRIYEQTGYMSVVSAVSDSDMQRNNLRLLVEHAKEFERNGYRGLSKFVSYIDRLQENDGDLQAASDLRLSSYNAVRVMSIHASKGLEYPVCFLANTARQYINDSSAPVLLHSKYGFAGKLRDKNLCATYTTMPREALALEINRSKMSEELRILYVAMTRAKEKLIMLVSKSNIQSYVSNLSSKLALSKSISPYLVRSAIRLSDLIVMCALQNRGCKALADYCDIDNLYLSDDAKEWKIEVVDGCAFSDDDEKAVQSSDNEAVDKEVISLLNERKMYKYPNSKLTLLPSKVAASDLSHKLSDYSFDRILKTPSFVIPERISGSEKGTALHLFMQYADFENARNSFEDELKRLKSNGTLTEIQAQSVDSDRAKRFIESTLITRCINSEKVFKEYRFSCEIDASLVDESIEPDSIKEKIVLQGSVDLAFLEDGKLVIVDYKTDRVKDESSLVSMYSKQLEIYAFALKECTDYEVKQRLIYSVHLSKEIEV